MFEKLQASTNANFHLDITEKQLEDAFVSYGAYSIHMTPVARQVRLNSGVADVLCRIGNKKWCVVELKARPLTDKDLAQVMAYTNELRSKHLQFMFMPLLIGKSVSGDYLKHCIAHLDEIERVRFSSTAFYGLYSFTACDGLSFNWINQASEESWKSRAKAVVDQLERFERAGRSTENLPLILRPKNEGKS